MLLKGVELGNILILLAIVVVAIVIIRVALSDDREVSTFTLKRRIMHLHVLSKHFDTTLQAIYRRYMYIQLPPGPQSLNGNVHVGLSSISYLPGF